MQHYQARQSTQTFNVLAIFIFAVVVLQGIAVAKHQQKTYPESGKVIAGGLNQLTVDGPAMGSAGKCANKIYSRLQGPDGDGCKTVNTSNWTESKTTNATPVAGQLHQ